MTNPFTFLTNNVITFTKNEPGLHDKLTPGDKIILVKWFDEAFPRTKHFTIHTHNFLPTKNLSGEICCSGWLGSTDGINKTALGEYEIIEMEQVLGFVDDYARKHKRKSVTGVKFTVEKID